MVVTSVSYLGLPLALLICSAGRASGQQATPHNTYSSGGVQYYLVVVTNGQRDNGYANTPVNQTANTSDPAVGYYIKPLPGRFSRLRYECGYRDHGVLGYLELAGDWRWDAGPGQLLTASSMASRIDGNAIWDPKVPGWDGNSSALWSNIQYGLHFPSFGTEGFLQLDGSAWIDTQGNQRPTFACDPQRNSFGTSDNDWAASPTQGDVRFVRLWLGYEPLPNHVLEDSISRWWLVAISNGATADPLIDQEANASDPAVGEYVKPVYGRFKALRYECGYRTAGVLGYVLLEGTWDWTVGSFLVAANVSRVNHNVTWDPALPGFAGDSDQAWTNVKAGRNSPTFGVAGFKQVDGREWVTNGTRQASFACNPKLATDPGDYNTWAPSPTPVDIKFVRLWLAATYTTTTTSSTSSSTSSTTTTTSTSSTTSSSSYTTTSATYTTTTTSLTSSTSSSTSSTTTTTSASSTTSSSSYTTTSATYTTTTTSLTSSTSSSTSSTTTMTSAPSTTSSSSHTTTTSATTTSTTISTTATTTIPAIFTSLAALLHQLQQPGPPDVLSKSLPGAEVTTFRARAGVASPGGVRTFSAAALGRGTVEAAIPQAVLQGAGVGCEVEVVSYNAAANFSEADGSPGPDFEGVLSAVLSVRLWADGEYVPVSDLPASTPVTLTLPYNRTVHPGGVCAYWDVAARRWSSDGVVGWSREDGAQVCESTHLTSFAVVLRSILAQLECTNVQGLTADGLRRIPGRWARRAPAVLLWLLIACGVSWVLYGVWADRRASQAGLRHDSFYLAHVPENRRTPLGPAYCLFAAASVLGACRAAPRMCAQLCCAGRTRRSALVPALARRVAVRIAATGVRSVVASWQGLGVTDVRDHVWGARGFTRVEVARQRSEQLCRKLDSAQAAVPAAFRAFFCSMGLFGRVRVILAAVHPLCGLSRLHLGMSAAKRAKLTFDALLGALVITALFFSATGSALSVRSPAECAGEKMNPIRFILIGITSSLLVKVPLTVVAHAQVRAFVHEEHWGPDTEKVQTRWWKWMDVLFWCFGCLWSGFCVLFLLSFLANLSPSDDAKWITAFVSVVLRMLVVWPVLAALALAAVATFVAKLQPDFVRHGDPGFGFEPWPGEAHRKVEELARRSMTVGDLLDFYALLGSKDVMPHFDPDRSTTHDVVRQAIIPLSRRPDLPGGGAAYAAVVARGQDRLPGKMVTHNWGNRFAHLCAAIFADCLGHRSYAACLALLRLGLPGVARLREMLRPRLHKTYWVCAFCVNQHAGICAQAPPTDSAGHPIEKCTCPCEKFTSGDECEMNKFDEMMMHLKAISPGLMHVVAVDSEFVVFSRIWCVAELLGGFRLKLPQALQVESQNCVDAHKAALASFDVRRAQSSVPEDKDFILSKVEDKDAFNRQLKDLVLDPMKGLLALWSADGLVASAASALLQEGGNIILHHAADLFV